MKLSLEWLNQHEKMKELGGKLQNLFWWTIFWYSKYILTKIKKVDHLLEEVYSSTIILIGSQIQVTFSGKITWPLSFV